MEVFKFISFSKLIAFFIKRIEGSPKGRICCRLLKKIIGENKLLYFQ